MALTGLLGTGSSTPGNILLGSGSAVITAPPTPAVDLGVPLPDLQLVIEYAAGKRILNGNGAHSVAMRLQWNSTAPGGHNALSATIPETERLANTATYRYGATATLRQAPAVGALAETGQVFWQGYLRTPIPSDDGTCDLVANGWSHLLSERDDALLWQTRYYGDWQPADAEGFALGITNDGIDSQVNNTSLQWSVKKGTELQNNDKAKLVWYYADDTNTDVLPRRVAMTVYKNQIVPGGASPNYSLVLERYLGPTSNDTRPNVQVHDLVAALGNNNTGDQGTSVIDSITQASPHHPVIALTFYRNTNTDQQTGAGSSFKVTCRDVRLNDIATGDSYLSSSVISDLADNARLAFTVGSTMVPATTRNILPLFWQGDSWWALVEYLAVGENVKWMVWEKNPNPEFEFRDWSLGTTWTATGYGTSATAIAQLSPDDEVYSHIDVSYTRGGSARIRHARAAVSPDPFAGLTPPRVRSFGYALRDPQPDGTLAQAIADALAVEFGTEQYAGTVLASFVTLGVADRTVYEVRAGDLLTLSDFPGGARTVRIYGADHRDDGPSTLTIGRVPSRLDRFLWIADLKRKRRGTLQ